LGLSTLQLAAVDEADEQPAEEGPKEVTRGEYVKQQSEHNSSALPVTSEEEAGGADDTTPLEPEAQAPAQAPDGAEAEPTGEEEPNKSAEPEIAVASEPPMLIIPAADPAGKPITVKVSIEHSGTIDVRHGSDSESSRRPSGRHSRGSTSGKSRHSTPAGRTEALEAMAAEFEREIEARKAGDASGWWQDAVDAPGADDTEGGHEFEWEADAASESQADAASEPQADADSALQPSHATRRSRASRTSRRSGYQPSEATSVQDDQSEAPSRRDWW
jgi:hypothetical protein